MVTMLDDMIASGTALVQWDWRITLFAISLSPFALTYLITYLWATIAARSNGKGKSPPMVPYAVPILGNLLAFAFDTCRFVGVNK